MLRFDDMDAVQDFLDLIDDYRADYHSLNDNWMLLSQVDPGVNDMEDEIGYLCISSLYDSLEYLDDEFRSNARGVLDIYIGDPSMQLVLNRYHEVWVEDTIYKVVANYKFYKIVGADVDVLNSIRSDPDEPTVDTNTVLEYFNDNVPGIKFRGEGCRAKLIFKEEPPASGINPTVHVKLLMLDQDNNMSDCNAGTVTVNWGDGSQPTTNGSNSTMTHQYTVGGNSTVTFTISASLALTFPDYCLGCDVGTYEASTTYTVTNNYCKKVCTDKIVLPEVDFSAGGSDWKYIGWGGQNPTFKFLNDPKVWGEIYTYKKNSNGNYKRKRPDIASDVRIFKKTFKHEDCSLLDNSFDNHKGERDSRVRVVYYDHRTFSTQNELSDEPLLDFKVFITSSLTPNNSQSNKELHPD